MREVICILESNSSKRSFQDAVEASALQGNVLEHLHCQGATFRRALQLPPREDAKSIWAQLSRVLERAILIPPSCSTIATHLSRRIPVEPVTERASGRPRKLDPRPGDVLAEAPHVSFLFSLPLPLSFPVLLLLPRSHRSWRLLHFDSHTHTRAVRVATRAAIRKKIAYITRMWCTYECVCVCAQHSLGGYGIARSERGFPACGERIAGE